MRSGFGKGFQGPNVGLTAGFNFGLNRPDQLSTSGLMLHLDASNALSYPGSGATWFDLATDPAANNATLINTPTFSTDKGGYFNFAKASSESATVSGTGLVPQTTYTKAVWFNLTDLSSDHNLVSSETGGHFMYFAGTNRLYSGHSNWAVFPSYPSSQTFSAGVWYFAVLTFNTTDGMALYVNGTLDSTYTANKAAHSGDGSVNLGRYGVGNFLNGNIAQVLTYNRSLTSTEVADLFNITKGRFGI
jgi:hypothetical protein